MQQLNLDISTLQQQLSHLGWTADFREQDGEIVYALTTPQGRHYSESFTNLPINKLKEAMAQAKENISSMESAPPFVMSPQPTKRGAVDSTPAKDSGTVKHDEGIVQQSCNYQEFLKQKQVTSSATGFKVDDEVLNSNLFDFQRQIVKLALHKGKFCVFAGCGLGKSIVQLEWASQVVKYTQGKVLILAPLAVATQTVREAEKFGIESTVGYVRSHKEINTNIVVTNYEMLSKFDSSEFVGVVLDESSILKSFTSKTRNEILESFVQTPYRLACSATPAPNDYMELGNHAEFVNAMSREEMLAMFFTHDGGDTSKWRLKGHAESKFWEWVASWAVMMRSPKDLGFKAKGFDLPPLQVNEIVTTTHIEPTDGTLFFTEAKTLTEQRKVRKASLSERVSKCAELVNNSTEQWLVWCDLNDESKMLAESIADAVEVKGSDTNEHKESAMLGFAEGMHRVLISKPSICGFGMNFQNCHNMAFVGLSHSFEQYYQAVRRCWRFGQEHPVNVHIIYDQLEGAVIRNIERKEKESDKMANEMVKHMKDSILQEMQLTRSETEYKRESAEGKGWKIYLGDCVEVVSSLPSDSIHYSIYSPPFASLYTYSNSDRDMGNCKDDNEFYQHFRFLVRELYRVIMPGRLLSFHCMNLPTSKARDGFIGIRDFRGELIRMFTEEGWIFHSEVVIWKDPVVSMQRTKALGLLHKQLVKDSAMSRQGIPDYLVTMRKPGGNIEPVSGELIDFVGENSPVATGNKTKDSINIWQRYASPVWMDINPSKTLQASPAREEKDERHICPLQLQVIERALQLWTNPGDTILDPFNGIGSTGWVCLEQNRKYIGVELKRSYFDVAVKNLEHQDTHLSSRLPLFG